MLDHRAAPGGGPRGRRWLILALLLTTVLGAQLAVSVGWLDGRYRHRFQVPEPGLELDAGQTIGLPGDGRVAAYCHYLLLVKTTAPGGSARLTVGPTRETATHLPFRQDKGDFRFRVDCGRIPAGPLVLHNPGASRLRITRAEIRNFSAENAGVPRFVQFLDPAGRVAPRWPVSLALLAAGLALQLGALRWLAAESPRWPATWRTGMVLAGPLFGLGVWLALRAGGRFLVVAPETFLILSGLALGSRLLLAAPAPLGRLAVGAYRSPRWRRGAVASLELAPAMLPALVLFVYLPLSIYLPNQPGFNYYLFTLLPFALAAVAWAILVGILRWWSPRRAEGLVQVLFLLGLYALMLELVTPVEVGPLDGGPIAQRLKVHAAATPIQLALLLALVGFWLTVRWERIRGLAQGVTVALLLSQAVVFAWQVSPESDYSYGVDPRPRGTHPPPPVAARAGNVYQVVLDAFSNQVLLKILADPALASLFDGFVFLASARSNMLDTTESIPSFMTGSFLPPKEPGQDDVAWWRRTVARWRGGCETGGILGHAFGLGYTITQYVPKLEWCPHVRTTQLRLGTDLQQDNKVVAAFADLWLLKVAPAALKRAVFAERTTGPFESMLDEPGEGEWGYWSIRHMAQLVLDEAGRPAHGQYVWAHFGTPHPPSVVDAQCEYVGDRWRKNWADGYQEQATCAIRLAGQLIQELKRLGRFDDATIIFQSDHGVGTPEVRDPDLVMPAWLEERLDREARREGIARWINSRSMALWLVKRPGAEPAPLRVDRRPVSLIDLAQTLYELKGWPVRSPEGCSVFRADLPARRDVHLFLHFPGGALAPDARRDWHLVSNGRDWRIVEPYPAEAPRERSTAGPGSSDDRADCGPAR